MEYILLDKNTYYCMVTETNAIKKTSDLSEATCFDTKEKALKTKQRASKKLKNFVVMTKEEIEQALETTGEIPQKTPRRAFKDSERIAVYNKACGCCQICGEFVPMNSFSVDHIIPISKGGTYDLDNLQLAHIKCNRMKDDEVPNAFFDKMIDILEFQAKKNRRIRDKLKRRFGK